MYFFGKEELQLKKNKLIKKKCYIYNYKKKKEKSSLVETLLDYDTMLSYRVVNFERISSKTLP